MVISFVQLIHSIFVQPVFARVYFRLAFMYDIDISCPILFSASVTSSVCQAVTMYCLLLLFVKHLIEQRYPNEARERNSGIVGTILISVLSVIVIVPVIKTQSTSSCFGSVDYDVFVGLHVLENLLPNSLWCVAGIILIISHAVCRQPLDQDGLTSQRPSTIPTHIVFAAFTTVVTTMPYGISRVVTFTCHNAVVCKQLLWMWDVFVMAAYSINVFIPCSWLLDKGFRASFKTMLRRKKTQTRYAAPMPAYSNYPHQPNQLTYTSQQIPIFHTATHDAPSAIVDTTSVNPKHHKI
ncbi:hypothetical protein SNE40_017778 [Patella caerulea]